MIYLRGHSVGVTALAQVRGEWLISGDEEGNLALWNYHVKKRHSYYQSVAKSRIQSLKVIKLFIDGNPHDILVCQSRDDGIKLLDITHRLLNLTSLQELATFDSFPSLFSRGDAMNIDQNKALLAFPSSLANHLVTIRILGDEAKTEVSGTAQRYALEGERSCPVFDLKLKQHPKDDSYWNLYAAFEDGCLCAYTFRSDVTKSVPSLNAEGLDIKLIKKFDLKICDFISAFDIANTKDGAIAAVCGSPDKTLSFISDDLEPETTPKLETIELRRRGVSALTIGPDGQSFALAGWDNVLYYYCMNSRDCLGSFKHTKQLQDLCYIRNEHTREDDIYELCCASMHGVVLTMPSIQKDA